MKNTLFLLVGSVGVSLLSACSTQPEILYMTYTHANGRVEVFPYVVPSTPGYVSNSTTTVYKDAYGGVIGYSTTTGPSK